MRAGSARVRRFRCCRRCRRSCRRSRHPALRGSRGRRPRRVHLLAAQATGMRHHDTRWSPCKQHACEDLPPRACSGARPGLPPVPDTPPAVRTPAYSFCRLPRLFAARQCGGHGEKGRSSGCWRQPTASVPALMHAPLPPRRARCIPKPNLTRRLPLPAGHWYRGGRSLHCVSIANGRGAAWEGHTA